MAGYPAVGLIALILLAWTTDLVPGQTTSEASPPSDRPRPSASRLANADAMRKQLGLSPAYSNVLGLDDIKVAILDFGFEGIDGTRPYLPANAVVVENYDPEFVRKFQLGDPAYTKGFMPGNSHGRAMAQIIWGITGFRPNGPRFFLLNANGPTMLRRGVRYAMEAKVDIILFSGAFEGGGNGDGHGPINAIVNEALQAGIIWINSAGNYGGRVYQGPIQPLPNSFLQLGRTASSTALRFRNFLDENTLTITLTWNDYRDQEDAGTDKDLDLYVQDNQGRVLGSSLLTQVNGDKAAGPGESRNPRERVVLTDLAADPDHYYWIRVRARSKNFTASDRLRVLITASRDAPVRDPKAGTMFGSIDFVDASNSGEIFPPADNPGVITVGDATRSSGTGTVENGRVKPDAILENSTAPFSNGEETAGSSNAAAYFAGVVAVLKAAQPNLATRHLLALARRGDVPDADQVVSGGTSTRSISGSSPLPTLPSSPPPAIQGMPLTENQLRALRYAEQLQRAQQARGQAPGGVWISLGNGRQVQVRLPNFMSPPVNPGYSLSPPTPTQPGRSGSTTPTPVVKRPPPAQTPWRTPSPGYLADLVRSQ